MISGAADSYNLVPVDPHINAQGEHRGPKGSGIEGKTCKTLTIRNGGWTRLPSPRSLFYFCANRNLTEKTMYGIHLYIAIKLFLTYELISAAPRANGGEEKVGGWKKRGREGNLGFEKVGGVKLEKDGKRGWEGERVGKKVGGEKGGKKGGREKLEKKVGGKRVWKKEGETLASKVLI